jgi:asparagine synthase (glutamine-hydrolysing)
VEGHVTPFAEVRALRAGEYLLSDEEGGVKEQGFFHRLTQDVSRETYHRLNALPESAHIQNLDRMLRRSVEIHLASDAPLGVLCSGGIDSSLITALTHRFRPDVSIFHATYDGAKSEEPYARQVAAHLGCEINYARMTKEYYLNNMVRAVWHGDLPAYHPNDISLHSVCELARQHGCKVLLSGEGADELLGGYPWHQKALRRYRAVAFLRRIPKFAKRMSSRFLGLLDHWSELSSAPGDALWNVAYPQDSRRSLAQAAQGALSSGALWHTWKRSLETYRFVADDVERQTLASIFSNLSGHLDTILWRNDRIGMMNSIENRVPFLENDLMAYGVNLPLKLKIQSGEGKWLLKQVARKYLPEEVVFRPKAGFPVPWKSYLNMPRSSWKSGFIAGYFELTPEMIEAWIAGDPVLRFRLVNIEIWGRLFVGRQPVSEVELWLRNCVGS